MSAGTRRWWHMMVDVAVPVVLCTLAMVPLATTYDDARFWLAVAGGVGLGAGAALLTTRLRWGAFETGVIAMAAYFAFGGLFALRESAIGGIVPSLATLRDLALGVVYGWKQLLTVNPPVNSFEQLYGVPYLAALIGTVLAVAFALRLSRPGVALVPVTALMVFSMLFGDYHVPAPAMVGAATAAVGLGWMAWRRALDGRANQTVEVTSTEGERGRAATRTAALGAAVLVAATVVGGGAISLTADEMHRTLLREQVVPPLEVHSYASPLMSFRKYVTDGKDSTLFTVSGLPSGSRIRLASLDLYDGIVYKVSGAGGEGSGVFTRVGKSVAAPPDGTPATVRFQIKDLRGVWLPDVGYLRTAEFAGARRELLKAGLNYNAATGTSVATAGLAEGDSYDLQVTIPPTLTDADLADATIAKVTTPVPRQVPDAIQDRLDEAVTGTEAPLEQVKAIATYLHDKGGLSHGLATDLVPSRPGHTFERLSSMLGAEQLVGDDEQFSVTMALMLAQAGIPVRVVMGFVPPSVATEGETSVTAADVRAWVEVPVDGHGWVAFDPTPERLPDQQKPESRLKPKVQVPQPPLPPQEPANLPPQPPAADQADEDRGPDLSWLWTVAKVGGISLSVLIVLFGPALVMLWLKRRRRLGRRTSPAIPDRYSGGWAEVMDAAADAGVRTSPVATRREHAVLLGGQYPDLGLGPLATRADMAVFGDGEPAQDELEAYWDDVESARRGIVRSSSPRQRLLQFFWPASVIGLARKWGAR